MGFGFSLVHCDQKFRAHASKDQVAHAFDGREVALGVWSLFGDIEQRTIAQDLEGRAIDGAGALVA